MSRLVPADECEFYPEWSLDGARVSLNSWDRKDPDGLLLNVQWPDNTQGPADCAAWTGNFGHGGLHRQVSVEVLSPQRGCLPEEYVLG